MSFLGGLGSIAGGASQSVSPYLQEYLGQMKQNNEDTAAGLGIYAMMGMTPPQSAPAQAPAQMGQVMPPQTASAPPPAPPPAPTGVARSPMAQPSAAPMAPPPQASAMAAPSPFTPLAGPAAPAPAPAVASRPVPMSPAAPGAAPPVAPPLAQAKAMSPAAPGPLPAGNAMGAQGQGLPPPQQGQPPVQAAQQQPPQQNQQPGRGGNLSQFDGMFDFNTLMRNLVKTPGMNPRKLGMITRSPAFERMLTQEGLNQYRALNLGVRGFNADTARMGQGERAREDQTKDTRYADNERYRQEATVWAQKYKVGNQTISGIDKDASTKIAAINAAVQRGDIGPPEAQKQIQAINQARDDAREKVQKEIGDPPEAQGGEKSPDSGGGAEADVIHDPKTGKMYKYKGAGDRGDMGSYAPVQ